MSDKVSELGFVNRMDAENRRLKDRVELLTAALTEIADCPDVCLNAFDLGNDCPVCLARAALAAGETESEEKP